MRCLPVCTLTLLAWLFAAPVEAAPRDAIARVSGCGAPALATFITSWRDPQLLAVTTASAVTNPDGEPCSSPVLVLPRDRGRLLATVRTVRHADDLAVLELAPDQALPSELETLVVADRSSFNAVLYGNRAVRVHSDIDDRGVVHERIALLEGGDRSGFALSWLHPLTWPWLPGAPVVGDEGYLLGILGAPEDQHSVPRGTGGAIHAFVNLHDELRRPTPPRHYGIWLARLRGDDDLEDFWALAHAVRKELMRTGLDPGLWEIRDLGLVIDEPQDEVERLAKQLGGSVNASLVVATTWDHGVDKVRRHRAMLVQLPREAAIGEQAPDSDPAPLGRRGEVLVLPAEAKERRRMVAQAVAAMAAADVVRLHPERQPDPRRTLTKALARLQLLADEHVHWRSGMSRSSATAALWAREGTATFARIRADLMLALQARVGEDALGKGDSPYEAAERSYRRAARELPQDERPCAWLEVQRLRVDAWLSLPEHLRDPQRLEELLHDSSEALQVVQADRCPVDRARLQRQRGTLLGLRITDNPDVDLRAAIDAFQEAVDAFSLVSHPLEWALTQLDLGLAWQRLPDADQAEVLEAAIGAHESALTMLDPDLFPRAWALGQARLGDALADNPVGDAFDNRRQALEAYERALTVFDRESDPVEWARTRNGMGAALQGLPWQDPPEHLQQALQAHQDALTVFDRERHPADWALTHAWLGNAIRQLPGDKPEAAFQGALLGFERSLEVLDELGRRRDWAATQIKRGDTWRASPAGERADNLGKAIEAYEQALEVYTRDADPENWAQCWQRLGQTWREQRAGDRAANLARSVEAFTFALDVHTAQGNPIAWELTQGDLFVAQAWQYALEAREEGGYEAALAHGEAALQEALLRKSRRLPQSGEDLFAEASDHFERASQLAPDRAEPRDGLALALWYQDRFAEAASAQEQVVELRPRDAWAKRSLDLYRLRSRIAARAEDVDAWTQLAEHYELDGDRVGALEAWSRVLTLEPGGGRALSRVVELALQADRQEQAQRALDLAMVHAPDDPDVLGAAVLLYTTAAPDLARARELATKRVAVEPASFDAQADLAMLELLFGRTTQAAFTINALLDRAQSPTPEAHLRLHVLRLAAGLSLQDVGADLLDAYVAMPEGSRAEATWELLRSHVEASLPPHRSEPVLAIFGLLQQSRSAEGEASLRALLGQP